ncbi:uncharacterized protein E5676_scaffold859G00550 [Cucumis melo var. makuwa]|uniref:Uncharacterized protein n=1 Tax=Cucumis melo var. makuwa TaxID=1194695 RepID=A0A5D3DE15_CUCMM|nr:uncharacterized protein E5676_scaffold859G00550 [Cucumis melo var. makuwa]
MQKEHDKDKRTTFGVLLSLWFGHWPSTYLGLPLGGNSTSYAFWQPVIERIHHKLHNWKYACVSNGCHHMLIWASLSCLPTYYLSLYHAPFGVIQSLEKLIRDFFWDGASLLKARMWFLHDSNALWRQLIYSGFIKISVEVHLSDYRFGSQPSRTRHHLGNGKSISFWKAPWLNCGISPSVFPHLFCLACFPNIKVAGVWVEDAAAWDLCLRRNLTDSEIVERMALSQHLQSVSFHEVSASWI